MKPGVFVQGRIGRVGDLSFIRGALIVGFAGHRLRRAQLYLADAYEEVFLDERL